MERIFSQYRSKMNISDFQPVYEYICIDEKDKDEVISDSK